MCLPVCVSAATPRGAQGDRVRAPDAGAAHGDPDRDGQSRHCRHCGDRLGKDVCLLAADDGTVCGVVLVWYCVRCFTGVVLVLG